MATESLTAKNPRIGMPAGPPNTIWRVFQGMAPVLVLYVLYSLVRWAVANRGPRVGIAHAAWILDLESRLHIDWELPLQHAVLPHTWLIRAANWYYVAFLPILIVCAVLGAWRASSAFRWWRAVFCLSLLIALVGYASYPLAPPRLLPPSAGFVDTLLRYGPHYYGNAKGKSLFNGYGSLPSSVNIYAAMPSMHVAWSVIAGMLFAASMKNRWWAVTIGAIHPMLMAFAVIATANHYVLDVATGLVVLAVAILLTELPVWRFGHQTVPERATA